MGITLSKSFFISGRNISSKAVGKDNWDRIDISSDYKPTEGSVLEDISVKRALRLSSNPTIRPYPNDIRFQINMKNDVQVGSDIIMTLNMRNSSTKNLKVIAMIGGHVVMYNGMSVEQVKNIEAQVEIRPFSCKFDGFLCFSFFYDMRKGAIGGLLFGGRPSF